MRVLVVFLLIISCSVTAQTTKPVLSAAGYGLTKKQADELGSRLWQACLKSLSTQLKSEWDSRELRVGDHSLKFKYKVSGQKPADGRSLYISMHGGGNATQELNDQQWNNQIRLYSPSEGVYVAPRAPTNTWNLWHEAHIDTLFYRLIEAAVAFEGVNPNKVYLMGYSAGGDGTYQLAPRMADRWAAAAMMAGHPNETSPLGLRNIGFTIHMGALDSAYKRNDIARRWSVILDSLSKDDPGGYKHFVQLHEGRGHWMNREDSVAVPWMAAFRRNPLPARVVWKQDDVNHLSFYWLAVPRKSVKTGGEIVASYKGNEIDVAKNYSDTLIIRLNDKMVDLDKPVKLNYLGKQIFKGKLQRKVSVIKKTIDERKDPDLIFSSELVIVKGKVIKQ
ncbi:hypothetical protein BDE36_1652 [Arcticibacter tournemirensis]|uniref:Alpha/beta hydrolase n=1 Tax=Arcticibacter tournemirensis TaxID=699437 RepID=A0A5M9GJR2_9SPHI|nr:alpha/beta hydrolase [Arcticibacter tournemirensis]KAA8473975.1 alpha/beta hydrolase [Arcticibacter tournemirensis]TQM49923.1 hypothetical protein BDE36_1652 [Arcticibacter tournemirensis]